MGVEQVCDLCHRVTFDMKPLTSIRALRSRQGPLLSDSAFEPGFI